MFANADSIDEGTWVQLGKVLSNLQVTKLLSAVIILLLGLLLVNILSKILRKLLKKSGRLDLSLREFLLKTIKLLLYFVLFIIIASQLGIPITSLITILGALGLAVSLALQDSLSNVAGGLFLLSSKPFSTGDFIEAGAFSGTVAEIGVIHTVLVTIDNRRIYIPNGKLADETVVNFSVADKRRIDLTFPVAYESDLAKARAVIEGTIAKDTRVLSEPEPPFVRVWELSDSSVDIMTRFWCKTEDYWELRSAALESVKGALDSAGVSIPYNHLTVEMKKQ
ncbi:MAG: mechanosensitive ion channel family protein [Oscillospiraceae bacterium]|jgi:small conductance mechanosensitive channel|nr:mechanosensitive ion channel family protein [Oscillospiraceae bacterium]